MCVYFISTSVLRCILTIFYLLINVDADLKKKIASFWRHQRNEQELVYFVRCMHNRWVWSVSVWVQNWSGHGLDLWMMLPSWKLNDLTSWTTIITLSFSMFDICKSPSCHHKYVLNIVLVSDILFGFHFHNNKKSDRHHTLPSLKDKNKRNEPLGFTDSWSFETDSECYVYILTCTQSCDWLGLCSGWSWTLCWLLSEVIKLTLEL